MSLGVFQFRADVLNNFVEHIYAPWEQAKRLTGNSAAAARLPMRLVPFR